MEFILASSSPRRREILRYFSIPFQEVSHHFDESIIPWNGSLCDFAKILAEGKAKDVFLRHPTHCVIACDTVVGIDGDFLGKPKDKKEASLMLEKLSGKWHTVVTGVSVMYQGKLLSRYEETEVLMRHLTDEQREAYLKTNTWTDKAGAYAIQGIGSLMIERIEGCYYNVMGLPVGLLQKMLEEFHLDLWKWV